MLQPTPQDNSILLMVAGLQSEQRSMELTWPQRILFAAYQLAWYIGLPCIGLYFWLRGRKEPLYRQHLAERFGFATCQLDRPVWLHSASLGELRGAMPLIDKLLAENLPVFLTTLTPAGRQAATQRYADAIEASQLQVSYLPLEFSWAVAAFAQRIKPRCMISSEIDTWPVLLHRLKSMGIPLGFVNAQYPHQSFLNDQRWAQVRAAFFRAYDLVLCKSTLHAQRFLAVGCSSVQVVGELRFDLPIPQEHIQSAQRLRAEQAQWFSGRGVICLASVVEGEDEMLLSAYREFCLAMQAKGLAQPLLIYVPRSPQRFDAVADLIASHGFSVVRRSQDLTSDFQPVNTRSDAVDVLLGDSLGEMYFYLALADIVTVCGSFIPRGSHNVIEPLALHKPVLVGPSIWGIEYPGQEALAAGVLTQVPDTHALPEKWLAWFTQTSLQMQSTQAASAFMAAHSGSVEKHWHHLRTWLALP